MNRANFVSGAIGVAVGGGALAGASEFPPDVVMNVGPAFFPSMLAGMLVLASAILMVGAALEPAAAAEARAPLRWSFEDGRVRAAVTVAAVAGFTLVLGPLGFIPTSVLFLAGMMAMLGMRRPLPLLAVSVGVTAAIWLIFEKLLVLSLPAGILDSLLY